MVGSNGTMMAIRIVRSKLRKREEHSNSVHPADVILQAPPPALAPALVPEPVAFRQQPLWQFPPPLPPPYVYNNDQVILSTILDSHWLPMPAQTTSCGWCWWSYTLKPRAQPTHHFCCTFSCFIASSTLIVCYSLSTEPTAVVEVDLINR